MHRIGSLLRAPGRVGQLGRILFSREPLETTRFFLRLPRELALCATAAASTIRVAAELLAHRFGHPLHALVLLLLARGELLEPLERRVGFALRLLLLLRLLLHRLVLVAQLVRLQLEEIREVFGLLTAAASTTAAATLLSHLHLHVAIQCLGALKPLERLLLRGKGVAPLRLHELFFRGLHRGNGGFQLLLDVEERRVRP